MTSDYKDFLRETEQIEKIRQMPFNSLSILALRDVKKSKISKNIESRYLKMGFSEFLNKTGK